MESERQGQRFHFGFTDRLVAEVGQVPLRDLHTDADAICRAYEKVVPVAERLGVEPPKPRLAGFCYPHLTALGCEALFPENSEPNVRPIIHGPHEIDSIREPQDYLSTPVVAQRLETARELKRLRPDASGDFIGHRLEGPVTTAVLLMGADFFTLPYDDPRRAHALLDFCVESALNYCHALAERQGKGPEPGPGSIPDDFAGIFRPELFPEFVLPYWDRLYEGLGATVRYLHSELLRVEHLRFLPQVGIEYFDPSADQYVTPELLAHHCPVPFQCQIQAWDMRELSPAELQELYRALAGFHPYAISFCMECLDQEPKVQALLEVARALAGGTS